MDNRNNRYAKQLSTVILGLFFVGTTYMFGQDIISPTPADHQVPLDKSLYEHGFNKDHLNEPEERENIDTVMVNSVMNYFVMPDAYYNKEYFLQNNYQKTEFTTSEFGWTVANGTVAAQNTNTTETSPWVKVTWGTTIGATTVKMKEIPQGLPTVCEGEEATIDVWVIAKPTVEFGQVNSKYEAMGCYTNETVKNAKYDFPISITSESYLYEVNYTITKKDLYTGTETLIKTVTAEKISNKETTLNIEFTEYGEYKIAITKITDRIARKCDMSGDITTDKKTFTYSALPQPKAGKVYHVPNNF